MRACVRAGLYGFFNILIMFTEGNAPLGFEPEGSCAYYGACTPVFEGSRSPPPCVQWAKSLSCLLQDDDGVELFRR